MPGASIFDACREVDALDVARELGLEFARHGGRAICPVCRRAPATLSFSKKLFHCFRCGIGGDAMRLAQICLDTTPFQAAQWVNREFACGYCAESGEVSQEARQRIEEARRRREEAEREEEARRFARDTLCWAEAYLRDNAPEAGSGMTAEYRALLNENYLFEAIWDAATGRKTEAEALAWGEVEALAELRQFTRSGLYGDKPGSGAPADGDRMLGCDKPRMHRAAVVYGRVDRRRAAGVQFAVQRIAKGAGESHAAQGDKPV